MAQKAPVFQCTSLAKKYHGKTALENVTLTQEQGKIYGLIGQNGAGKTTLMRIIAGLAFPTSGTIALFGEASRLDAVRKQCGFMIESCGLNLSMSARENIELHGTIRGLKLPLADVDELLGWVGLENTRKKTRSYSLGMKQRLGIALALIGYPKYLVLDEPINGLDPLGVVEIRNMLKRLREEKDMTILISSHNLPELFQTATDYIIIDRGKIVEELSLQELAAKCKKYIRVRTDEPERLRAVLKAALPTAETQLCADGSIRIFDCCDRLDELAGLFHQNQLLIRELTVMGDTLEQYFLSLLGGDCHAKPA